MGKIDYESLTLVISNDRPRRLLMYGSIRYAPPFSSRKLTAFEAYLSPQLGKNFSLTEEINTVADRRKFCCP